MIYISKVLATEKNYSPYLYLYLLQKESKPKATTTFSSRLQRIIFMLHFPILLRAKSIFVRNFRRETPEVMKCLTGSLLVSGKMAKTLPFSSSTYFIETARYAPRQRVPAKTTAIMNRSACLTTLQTFVRVVLRDVRGLNEKRTK